MIEITGIGFPNKGAELMLLAAVAALRERFGEGLPLCCCPSPGSEIGYRVLGKAGLLQRLWLQRKGTDFSRAVACLLPRKLLRTYGVVTEDEVTTVLDASGFGYSDQWGLPGAQLRAAEYRRLHDRGGRLVMLPQAFGPFRTPGFSRPMRSIVGCASRVYARDAQSASALRDIAGDSPVICESPDFTCLLSGVVPKAAETLRGWIAVIPNRRMIDKLGLGDGEQYETLLHTVISACRSRGWQVYLLNHEGPADADICERLRKRYDPPLPIFQSDSALEIKGVIGTAAGVITSRFHGLVSALVQGVPAMCTSWSHKYEALLHDFGRPDWMLRLDDQADSTKRQVIVWLAQGVEAGAVERERLSGIATEYKRKTRGLWDEVCAIIEGAPGRALR
jgi:hypothetical protein